MKFLLLAATLSAALATAQSAAPPAFEVASIKPDDTGGNYIEVTHGVVTAHSATPATCIQWAYGLQASQISAANSAISGQFESARYTIVAKTSGPTSDAQLRLMFQALLAERFHLSVRHESREIRVLAMVVEKSGPKFHQSSEDGESRMQAPSKLTRRWQSTTLAQLATNLGEAMRTPVLDETGLPGKFDFALDLTPYLDPNGRPDIAGMMVTAVREQLGLKLESRRQTSDILVIDRLDQPSAN